MAWLKRAQKMNPHERLDNGTTPSETIAAVAAEAHALIQEQYRLFNEVLQPELGKQGIHFYRRRNWTAGQQKWIEQYFDAELLPILTPIGLDPSHPFPRPLNKSLNFAVELEGTDAFGRPSGMAIVQAPRILPRVVPLPAELCDGGSGFVFLSSILHAHVGKLFPGMAVKGCHQFRLTRDSDLTVDEEDLKTCAPRFKTNCTTANTATACASKSPTPARPTSTTSCSPSSNSPPPSFTKSKARSTSCALMPCPIWLTVPTSSFPHAGQVV